MSDIGYTILLIGVFGSLAMALRVAEHRLRHLDRAGSHRAAATSAPATRSTVDG